MKSSCRRVGAVLRRVDGVEVVDAYNPGRQRIGAAARLPVGRGLFVGRAIASVVRILAKHHHRRAGLVVAAPSA